MTSARRSRIRFTSVPLNSPAPTSGSRKGILSIITVGLQGGTRSISNWLIGFFAGRAALGLVSSATAVALTLHTLWTSSTQSAASKFISRARGKGDETEIYAVTRHIGLRVIQAALLLSALAPVLWVIGYGGSIWEGLAISLILITVATNQFARGVHFGAGQVARGTRIDLLSSVIGIGTTAILIVAGVRNILLTVPLSLAMGTYALLCWPWSAKGRPEKALRSEIDKFVLFGAIGSIASAGMLQISQLIAKGISDHAAEINAPALQLITPLSLLTSALGLVLYPAMAEAQGAGDKERLRHQTHMATSAFIAVLVPCFGAVAIASRPIMLLVWGSLEYADSATLMPVYAIALLVYNVATPAVSSITSGEHKNMWYSLILSQAGLVSALIAWVLLVNQMGVFGVALGYAIGASVTSLGLMITAWRLNRLNWLALMARLILAMATIGGLSWWRQSQPINYPLDLATAGAFALIWTLASIPTLFQLWRQRRGTVAS